MPFVHWAPPLPSLPSMARESVVRVYVLYVVASWIGIAHHGCGMDHHCSLVVTKVNCKEELPEVFYLTSHS